MIAVDKDIFAFIKPSLDAHTLGINTVAELLRDCGYHVIIGDEIIENALNEIRYEANRKIVLDWLSINNINRIGISYRLDQDGAINMVGYFMNVLMNNNMLYYHRPIRAVYYGGYHNLEIIERNMAFKNFKGGSQF